MRMINVARKREKAYITGHVSELSCERNRAEADLETMDAQSTAGGSNGMSCHVTYQRQIHDKAICRSGAVIELTDRGDRPERRPEEVTGVEPKSGFEPLTYSLRVNCSTN